MTSIVSFYKSIGIDFVMDAAKSQKSQSGFLKEKLAEVKSLKELRALVEAFEGCDLKKIAKNTVFSDGNPDSKIMLVGEAPGEREDIEGIPFCGRSGKLLDKMLESIDLDRSKVYITNTIFWRPPGNRRPTPEEANLCRPFLQHHIRIFDPKLIVLVGGTAASSLLETEIGISRLRGKLYQYKNQHISHQVATTAIFHPSYLLRQPSQKTLAWQDLQFIKKYIDENNI